MCENSPTYLLKYTRIREAFSLGLVYKAMAGTLPLNLNHIRFQMFGFTIN
jgi:hypothetical protein